MAEQGNWVEGFVGKAKKAVWDGFDIVKPLNPDIGSWMFDAASILDIVQNDAEICRLLEEYYHNPSRFPWNKRAGE
jgi:hypothetical protein